MKNRRLSDLFFWATNRNMTVEKAMAAFLKQTGFEQRAPRFSIHEFMHIASNGVTGSAKDEGIASIFEIILCRGSFAKHNTEDTDIKETVTLPHPTIEEIATFCEKRRKNAQYETAHDLRKAQRSTGFKTALKLKESGTITQNIFNQYWHVSPEGKLILYGLRPDPHEEFLTEHPSFKSVFQAAFDNDPETCKRQQIHNDHVINSETFYQLFNQANALDAHIIKTQGRMLWQFSSATLLKMKLTDLGLSAYKDKNGLTRFKSTLKPATKTRTPQLKQRQYG
jgi:hypothetical protein